MLPKIQCCNGCTPETGRHSGCHGTCEKYLAEKKICDAEKQKFVDNKNKMYQYSYYIAERNNRKAKG